MDGIRDLIVGRTHTIVRLQTITRRKDGTENFGGFVYVLGRFLQRDFVLWVFMCLVNFSVSLFRLPRRGLPRPTALFSGYHAEGYHARTDIFKLTGYHVCSVTTPELPRFIQVFTPAGSFYIFFFSSADTSVLHNNNHNFSTETGAHRTDPHNTLACCVGPCGVRHAYIWPYMLTRVAGNVSY